MVVVIAVAAVAVTGVMLRAAAAVNVIQTVAQPTDGLSGAAFGIDSTVAVTTEPAQTAIAERAGPAANGSANWWDDVSGLVAGVPDTVGGAAAVANRQTTVPEPLTIMLVGVDARPGEPIDIGVRADAIAILRLDPEAGACRILTIPRDTRTELPGYGLSKVNHALAVGGIPYQIQVVEQLLRVDIDRYALADLRGFAEVVDAIGGVSLTVTESFTIDGVFFEPGARRLSGAEALAYVRYRGGVDSDFGRIARQHQVLRAIAADSNSLDLVRVIGELLPALENHVRTDLSPAELAGLVVYYQPTCGNDAVTMETLTGGAARFADPLVGQELSYIVVDETEITTKVDALLGPGE